MKDETKGPIHIALDILRECLVSEGVSMGMDPKNKKLIFFDTDVYLTTGKFDGFSVDVETLVK